MQERDGLWRVITVENMKGELGEAALVGSQGRWQTAWGKLLLSTDENGRVEEVEEVVEDEEYSDEANSSLRAPWCQQNCCLF